MISSINGLCAESRAENWVSLRITDNQSDFGANIANHQPGPLRHTTAGMRFVFGEPDEDYQDCLLPNISI